MKYTHYKNRFSSTKGGVSHLSGEWSDVVDLITDKSTWHSFTATDKDTYQKAKEQFDAIVMAEMKPNTSRTADNVIAFHAIVLDIDDGATYQDVRDALSKYEYVMYSSGGSGLKAGDRFRVIMPLNAPMPASDWKRFNTSLSERFSYSDECFKKGIQIQYLPVLNTAFADQFIAEHHTGQWFDYQNPEDLPYVETQSLELVTKNVVFDETQFTDAEFQELAAAIVSHQANSLGYEDRRLLAQRLKHIGMNDFDAVQVLDAVSSPGFTTPNNVLVSGANPLYAHVEGLYKHVAKGTRIPAIERRIVRPVEVMEASIYDGEYRLAQDEYLSDMFDLMDFSTGNNLLISDVGTGKSTQFMDYDENGVCTGTKRGYLFVAPLTSIVNSFTDDNKLSGSGVGTWNQIETIIREKDKTKFAKLTLVVDECHGLFEDYGYKSKLINRLIDSFKYFKSTILMSGTVEADNFSSIQFNKVYRVHKPSKAVKNIRSVFCTKKDEVVIDHINSLTNKTIVLMNNKDLCEVVSRRISCKSLVVNADVKNTPEVQQLFKGRRMNDHDVIIGTNSIVEGLSIEDELSDVDIVIWGDLVPERIEQFCNRFRNVSSTKNVWYFIDRKPVELLEDYERNVVLHEATTLCESLQGLYEGISNDVLKRSFIRQFIGDMARDLVYFHDGRFCVSYTGVDYEYAQHRAEQSRNDFSHFSARLSVFGFNVLYPLMVDGDELVADDIKEDKRIITEARKKEREMLLEALISDIEANTIEDESTAHELYTATYGSVIKLCAKGLEKDDVTAAIEGYIEDEQFFAKAHEDADFVQTGNTIRELVISEVGGRTELQSHESQHIADGIIQKVLDEYFNSDAQRMLSSRSWGSLIVKSHTYSTNDLNKRDPHVCELQAKSSKAVKEILSKYILLAKSKTRSIQGKNVRVLPIKALSRTGLRFRKLDFSNFIHPQIEKLKEQLSAKTEQKTAA
ncbi:hypothetical protein EDF81_0064 [Enterobacter sp. BIGb0383]|uniref:DEAD/DEAH box helicase family protein n=1 Tax=unclassified Enterobacter TaxID=2608935 RepID=UPI000F463DC5|nr:MULTISPECIES: DEAD/DEAH box helicase family protein [unclassified Enterobacter]ROP61593.1 hypothetical protein EDF81_0064 [Enterobacter sp. BIGb0383]ROS11754.1 hypothetical protein EC848_0064 [Enterobacter sp. BIGb0359]